MTAPEPVGLTDGELERSCEVMHDAYERAAVGAGWQTQEASRKPWRDVPEANKATMRAAIRALLADRADRLAGERAAHEALRDRVLAIHRLGLDGVCYGCWEAGGYDGAPNHPCPTALAAAAPTPPQDGTATDGGR